MAVRSRRAQPFPHRLRHILLVKMVRARRVGRRLERMLLEARA